MKNCLFYDLKHHLQPLGHEIITINFLFDSWSEASYFAAGDLEKFALTSKEKKFTLQSLSTQAGEETVEGQICGFDYLMASGKRIRLNALRQEGLSRNDLALRAKVLTCPKTFATLWKLQDHNVTQPLLLEPTNHLYTRSQSKMQMVIGLDCAHLYLIQPWPCSCCLSS